MYIKCCIFVLVLFKNYLNIIASECGCGETSRSKSIEDAPTFDSTQNGISNGYCTAPITTDFVHDEMVQISGGDYLVGTNEPIFESDQESPERSIHVNGYFIDKYEVSNAEFSQFIQATNYLTYSEKFGDSFVFQAQLTPTQQNLYKDSRVASVPWWYKVNGTSWKHPEGVDSSIGDRLDHPVVHVSWFDASAFCKWKGKRLPTEFEWEVACRGGKNQKLYPWGNKLQPGDKHWLNIWQGAFPNDNTGEDGFTSTCPINRFKQNDYDLYNMVGNVWEWTDTKWNESGDEEDLETVERVKKGGSYLCHKSYCYRYRCAARSSNTADSSAGNLGFRCAKSINQLD
ncbi:formylglycine-generating enzyme [Contarinia nasturtii]|uniref:formylglycine-generating enzyme n=1 Tax=Contarinia nasturtii TaxID=265458 RepID=UPI0012D3DC7C|nr:formylglycine-generating enzyme [Contarinia nasturtii]